MKSSHLLDEQASFILKGKVKYVCAKTDPNNITASVYEKIQVIKNHGIKGDYHSGTRLADVREETLLSFGLPKGIEIANHREFSAISEEELEEIREAMKLSHDIPAGCLGENLCISGIPNFTSLPTGTLLFFQNGNQKRTAVLCIWAENTPCFLPGKAIQHFFPEIPHLDKVFPKVARGKRGIVGSVYCSGFIKKGDTVIAHIPKQKIYKNPNSNET